MLLCACACRMSSLWRIFYKWHIWEVIRSRIWQKGKHCKWLHKYIKYIECQATLQHESPWAIQTTGRRFWISTDTAIVHSSFDISNIAENKAKFRLRFVWFLWARSFEGNLPSLWTLTPRWQGHCSQTWCACHPNCSGKTIFKLFSGFSLRSVNMLEYSWWLPRKYNPSFASGVRVWSYTFKTDWCINQ